VRFRSLRDEVVEELRDRIVEGDLAGGARLVERDLSTELQVSRVTIREALQQLASEGLLVLLPRRGAQVTSVDEHDLRNMQEVRACLEVLAARAAAERRDPEGLRRLQLCLQQAQDALAAADDRAATYANVAFHEEVVRCADNELLSSISAALHGRLLRIFRMTRQLRTDAVTDHQELFEAIEAQDADRAAALAGHHVESTAQATHQALVELSGESSPGR
jgi:DNA-binding GntR family transcriptional regulator